MAKNVAGRLYHDGCVDEALKESYKITEVVDAADLEGEVCENCNENFDEVIVNLKNAAATKNDDAPEQTA